MNGRHLVSSKIWTDEFGRRRVIPITQRPRKTIEQAPVTIVDMPMEERPMTEEETLGELETPDDLGTEEVFEADAIGATGPHMDKESPDGKFIYRDVYLKPLNQELIE